MKTPINLNEAQNIASEFIGRVQDNCERIQVAGSVRRKKERVGDIEIVAVPTPSLYAQLDNLATTPEYKKGMVRIQNRNGVSSWQPRWGDRYRVLEHRPTGVFIDLFLREPVAFGYMLWLRTGPADANEFVMSYLSLKKARARSRGGSFWWDHDRLLDTSEESAMFDILGIPYVEPEFRSVDMYGKYLTGNHHLPDMSAQTIEIAAIEQEPLF